MLTDRQIVALALTTLDIEAASITELKPGIGKSFTECIKLILHSKGRVVVTGIGKSAIIAQKIVATLNSTGTPSIFMHAADAVHGDLGIIQRDDIVLCISNSGSSAEIKVLLPLLKEKNKIIAISGNAESYLSKNADFVIDASVKKEACTINLAPTSSTTAQLAMGDALAVCLLECRGFTKEDFAKFHPGGSLGKRMYLKISDLYELNPKPKVQVKDSIREVILEISSGRLGAAAVLHDDKFVGIITDGDLRRMLEKKASIDELNAGNIMTSHPKTASPEMMAIDALQLMKRHNITQLVITEKNQYLGFVHLHDLLKEGLI